MKGSHGLFHAGGQVGIQGEIHLVDGIDMHQLAEHSWPTLAKDALKSPLPQYAEVVLHGAFTCIDYLCACRLKRTFPRGHLRVLQRRVGDKEERGGGEVG